MGIKFKENYKYSLVVPSSMGVRITPLGRQPVHCSDTFVMQATSSETNVASVLAYLGLPVKVLTAFVKDSPIAAFIKNDLKRRNISFEGRDIPQGGPWGYRHQFNIADSGYGCRGPRVHNDRAGEVGITLNTKDFDLYKIFERQGAAIVHMSGLIAALSRETGNFCLELARYAKKCGTIISFDLNYRASFWQGREKELRDIFTKIAQISDILIGNEEEYQLCLGVKGPKAGGRDIKAEIGGFKEMIKTAAKEFPDTSIFATTLREAISTNRHLWGVILSDGQNFHVIEPREIGVLDRIGGGDAFVGGLLYSILQGWDMEKCSQFGWSCGALVVTLLTDYAQPADEQQIWDIWQGNARVKR